MSKYFWTFFSIFLCFLRISYVKGKKDKDTVLVVSLDPTKISGDLKGVIDVVTNRPDDGKLSMSVFGVALPK